MRSNWRRTCAAVIAATAGAMGASSASAALLAYEGFDYSTGQTLGAQSSAEGGWSTGWMSDGALTTPSDAQVAAASLAAPVGYNSSAITGGSAFENPISLYRGLANSAQIDFGSDGTYYISYVIRRTQAGGSGGYSMLLQSSAGNVLNAGVSTGGNPFLILGSTALSSYGSNIVNYVSSYLWVLKVSTSESGNDVVSGYVYNSTSQAVDAAEPITWMWSSNVADLDDVVTKIVFSAGSGRQIEVDEVRIGESWADAVPEPATAGMLLAGLFAAAVRRRQA